MGHEVAAEDKQKNAAARLDRLNSLTTKLAPAGRGHDISLDSHSVEPAPLVRHVRVAARTLAPAGAPRTIAGLVPPNTDRFVR